MGRDRKVRGSGRKGLDPILEVASERAGLLAERVDSDEDNLDAAARKALNSLERGSPIAINKSMIWELFDAATRLSMQRHYRYKDYDLMEQDSLLASALELMTDDACQYSPERGASIWPSPGSDKAFIEAIFQELNIENRIWGWTYNTAKYGDFMLGIVEKEGEFKGVDDSIHPRDVKRIDIDGTLSAFAFSEQGEYRITDPWRFVHFINNFKPQFEKVILKRPSTKDSPGDGTAKEEDFEVTSRYGTSCLEAARKIYKVLNLLEQAVCLARLNRSPLIRVFYVNTEGLTPEQRDNTVERLKRHFKEQMSVNLQANLYKGEFKPLSFNADIFIPYTGGAGDVRTETLGGEINIKDMADIDYLKNKLFAAIRVPKGFLGFDEAVPGAMGQTALTRLDIRYARMIKKVQRAVIAGVKRLLAIIYAYRYKKNPLEKKVSIQMETISGVEEMDRMSGLERRLAVAQQMIGIMKDLESATEDATPVYDYTFNEILGLKDLGVRFKNKPPEGEGGFGAGFGGGGFPGQTPPQQGFPGQAPQQVPGEAPPEEQEPEMAGAVTSLTMIKDAIRSGKTDLPKVAPLIAELYRLSLRSEQIGSTDGNAALPNVAGSGPEPKFGKNTIVTEVKEDENGRDDGRSGNTGGKRRRTG